MRECQLISSASSSEADDNSSVFNSCYFNSEEDMIPSNKREVVKAQVTFKETDSLALSEDVSVPDKKRQDRVLYKTLEAWNEEMRQALRKALEENQELVGDTKLLIDTCESTEIKRACLSEENEKLKEEIDDLLDDIDEFKYKLKQQKEEHDAQYSGLQREIKRTCDSLKLEQVRTLEKIRTESRLLAKEKQTIEEERDELKELLEDAQKLLANKKSNSRTVDDASIVTDSTCRTLEARCRALTRENHALREEHVHMSERLKLWEEDQKDALKSIEHYHVEELNRQLLRFQEERDRLTKKLTKLQEENENLHQEAAEERGSKKEARRRIKTLEKQLLEYQIYHRNTNHTRQKSTIFRSSMSHCTSLHTAVTVSSSETSSSPTLASPNTTLPRQFSQDLGQTGKIQRHFERQCSRDPLPRNSFAGNMVSAFNKKITISKKESLSSRDALEKTARGSAKERARRMDLDRILSLGSKSRRPVEGSSVEENQDEDDVKYRAENEESKDMKDNHIENLLIAEKAVTRSSSRKLNIQVRNQAN